MDLAALKAWIGGIWTDVRKGNNIDLYLTVAASVSVGLLGLLGFAKDQIAPLTLAVLALLGVAGLKSRQLSEELSRKIDGQAAGEVSLDEVFQTTPPALHERIITAKTIDHNGMSLVGTSNSLLAALSSCLSTGGVIRFLLIDPESPSLVAAAQRFWKHQDHQRLKREIEHSLDNFTSLGSVTSGSFIVRLFQAVPPYSIWIIDKDTLSAEIWVGLYSYRAQVEPHLRLHPKKDKVMFDFFKQQFETMWGSSKEQKTIP